MAWSKLVIFEKCWLDKGQLGGGVDQSIYGMKDDSHFRGVLENFEPYLSIGVGGFVLGCWGDHNHNHNHTWVF